MEAYLGGDANPVYGTELYAEGAGAGGKRLAELHRISNFAA